MCTYKHKIRNHDKNKRLGNMLNDLAEVHNHFLCLEKRYFRIYGKYAGRYRLQPHLTKLLNRTKKHWAWIPRDTLDAVIIRLDTAYQRFFVYKKNGGKKVGLPKLKKPHKMRSAKFPTGYRLENGRLRISFKTWDAETQSLKFDRIWYSFHQHRDCQGNVRYVQILRDAAGEYWVYIITDDTSKEVLSATGKSVGIDFELKTFLTLSIGEKGQSPQFLKQSLNALRKLNKAVSRKVKGSNNQERQRKNVARIHKKTVNQRADHHWKLAIELCQQSDILFFEDLNLDGLKRLWGKQVSDLAFGEFLQKLKHQAKKRIRSVLKIGRWTPSTKCCSVCEHKNENLTLADREWTCPKCNTHLDRDHNAAINILKEGVASFGLGVVRPIVLLGKIVGYSVESTSLILNSTNAFA